jgi:hypothetical protein
MTKIVQTLMSRRINRVRVAKDVIRRPTVTPPSTVLAGRSVSDPTLNNSVEGKSRASRSNLTCPNNY